MNRPGRVRDGMAGYAAAPDFAWSGWRLKIPGGPYGGQYHGFIGPDSSGWPAGLDEIYRQTDSVAGLGAWGETEVSPYEHDWGGLAQREGETLSDHVYRSPGEMRPRPNASGGAHVVHGFQRRRSAGFAVAPGNYRGIGGMGLTADVPGGGTVTPYMQTPRIVHPYPYPVEPLRPLLPPHSVCPAWGCDGPPHWWGPGTVPQPAPPQLPAPAPTVPVATIPPISPAPAPTVSVSNDPQCLAMGMNGGPYPYCNAGGLSPIDSMTPAQGSPAAVAAGPGASPSISDWLSESTMISSIPNMYVAAGAALAAFLLLKKK